MIKTANIVERPGYFGRSRPEIENRLNETYPDGWKECWEVKGMILDFQEAVILYDDAYYHYLSHYANLEWLLSFGECFDHSPTDINCGVTHDPFTSPRHIQDISVRRALIRMGIYFEKFKGSNHSLYQPEELIQIRGKETNGHELMPGLIPFHHQDWILNNKLYPKWANPDSVEAFWQCNKVIVRL